MQEENQLEHVEGHNQKQCKKGETATATAPLLHEKSLLSCNQARGCLPEAASTGLGLVA